MKKPSKQTVETIKTVVIAVLLTSIVTFVAGMKFEQHLQAEIHEAVQTAELKQASE